MPIAKRLEVVVCAKPKRPNEGIGRIVKIERACKMARMERAQRWAVPISRQMDRTMSDAGDGKEPVKPKKFITGPTADFSALGGKPAIRQKRITWPIVTETVSSTL